MFNFFKKSWIPKLLPINREEDYHTHFIGKTLNEKSFFGYETFIFPNGVINEDWQKSRKEYVVLHLFDKKGNHLETKHWYAGTTSELSGDETRIKLDEMIQELGDIEYTDILVKPFKTTIDNIEFGLIPDNETKSIELQPSSTIAFFEPWNGEYDT